MVLSAVIAPPLLRFIGAFTVNVDVTNALGEVGSATLTLLATAGTPPVSGFGLGRDAFVTTLYVEDLGRLPEPSGLRYWSGALAHGVRPTVVARAIRSAALRLAATNQIPSPQGTLQSNYFDALRAGLQAAALHQPPSGPLTLTLTSR